MSNDSARVVAIALEFAERAAAFQNADTVIESNDGST
jgi:hypothetical protein